MKKKNTHGGARPNAGAKPKNGMRKEPMFIYLESDYIDILGGKDALKADTEEGLRAKAKKLLKIS